MEQVFSVGDNTNHGVIVSFEISGEQMIVKFDNGCFCNIRFLTKLPPQKEQSKSELQKKERIEVKDVSIKEILIRFEGPTLPQRKIDELKATIEKIINNEEWITASPNISEALREAEEKAFNAARKMVHSGSYVEDQLEKVLKSSLESMAAYKDASDYLNHKSKQ